MEFSWPLHFVSQTDASLRWSKQAEEFLDHDSVEPRRSRYFLDTPAFKEGTSMNISGFFMIFVAVCIFESTPFASYAHQGRYVVAYSVHERGGRALDKKIIRKIDCVPMRGKIKITAPEFAPAFACSAMSGGGIVLADVEGEVLSISVRLGALDGKCLGCHNLFVNPFVKAEKAHRLRGTRVQKFSGGGKVLLDKKGNATAGAAEINLKITARFFKRPASNESVFDVAWAYLGNSFHGKYISSAIAGFLAFNMAPPCFAGDKLVPCTRLNAAAQ